MTSKLDNINDLVNVKKNMNNNIIIEYGNTNYSIENNSVTSYKLLENNIISKNEVLQFIKNNKKNLLIYTGAGISKASGIPTMKDLKKSLFFNEEQKLITCALNTPKYLLKVFKIFEMKLYISKPNEFHYILKDFILKNNCILVTENLDIMHEKTGIKPLHTYGDFDKIINLSPKNVLLIGIRESMMNKVFDNWYKKGATFYSINNEEVKINVPCNLAIMNVEELYEDFINETK